MSLYSILRDREIGNRSGFQRRIENNTVQNFKNFKCRKTVCESRIFPLYSLKACDNLIVALSLKCIRLWDFDSCRVLKEIKFEPSGIRNKIKISNGKLIYLSYNLTDNTVSIFDLNRLSQIAHFQMGYNRIWDVNIDFSVERSLISLETADTKIFSLHKWSLRGEDRLIGETLIPNNRNNRFLDGKLFSFEKNAIFCFDPQTLETKTNSVTISENFAHHYILASDQKDFFLIGGNLEGVNITPFIALIDFNTLECMQTHFFEEFNKFYMKFLLIKEDLVFMAFKTGADRKKSEIWMFNLLTKEKKCLHRTDRDQINHLYAKDNLLIAEYILNDGLPRGLSLQIWQIPSMDLIFDHKFPNAVKAKYSEGCLLVAERNDSEGNYILTKMDFQITETGEE